MALHIDGTDRGAYVGLCARIEQGPYAIFDDKKQDWLRTGIRWLWLARLWLRWYEAKK